LAALTLPAVLLFTEHAFGDRVQGNWPAIVYPAAAIAATGSWSPIWHRLTTPAIATGLAITLLAYLLAIVPLLPAGIDPIARQLEGWDAFARQVEAAQREAGAAFVAADQYGVAAKLTRALPADVRMVSVDGRWAQTDLPRTAIAGQTGILVNNARMAGARSGGPWSTLTEIGQAARQRGGATIEQFWIYRVTGAADAKAAVVLPRP
jgi:hypothetical protein